MFKELGKVVVERSIEITRSGTRQIRCLPLVN